MMKTTQQLIRFDWAMKRILRDKANFGVLEGFLSVLLNETISIKQILSSQANKEMDDDKYNDVDILIENAKGELVIVEVQNTKQYDYFHRILYGASKVITQYIKEGELYSTIKKVISVTIAYFDLGQGKDYVYHGKNEFRGLHQNDVLTLSNRQQELYNRVHVYEIYPEYWIIKAGVFNQDAVNDKLDEWIYFLKTGEVKDEFTAAGLAEAKVKLDKIRLSPEERASYDAYTERLRSIASKEMTAIDDINEQVRKGVEKEMAKKEIDLVMGLHSIGVSIENIAKALSMSADRVQEIVNTHIN